MPVRSRRWPTSTGRRCSPVCCPMPSRRCSSPARARNPSSRCTIRPIPWVEGGVTSFAAAPGTTEAFSFPGERPVTPEVVREHNLNELEYNRIVELLGRTPTLTELGIFSALWSEHCSYKHSKPVLKTFPTTGPQVVQGPGENAGVLRLPDGWAVAFKIESHNHPSAVEPYQGAATGVGGILRDVFTMGARPVAL